MFNDSGNNSIGYIFSRRVLKRNLLLAIIVGCLLSIANQLDVILSQPLTARLAAKIFFNFLIPFTVSSISAVINREKK